MNSLPATALWRVCQYLDLRDVVCLSQASSSLYFAIRQNGPLWRRHCGRVWGCEELPTGSDGAKSWCEQWLYLCREFGRYRFCYPQVKSTWDQIESTLQARCPVAYCELMASHGLSERELDRLERKLGIRLPDDYRCSMRLHGVQSIPLGGVKYCDDRCIIQQKMLHLLGSNDVELVDMGPSWDPWRYHFTTIARSTHGSGPSKTCSTCLLMVTGEDGAEYSKVPMGNVFLAYSISVPIHSVSHEHGGSTGLTQWRRMPTASTFAEWLSAEADRLQYYHVTNQDHQLTRFILHPDSVAVTGGFTIRVATAVVPDHAVLSDECYLSALCLTVELSEDAPLKEGCWLVRDCVKINGQKVDSHSSTFALQTLPDSSVTCLPGCVVECVSRLVQVPHQNAILEGYLVVRTLQSNKEFQLPLPQVHLEPFSSIAINSLHDFRT